MMSDAQVIIQPFEMDRQTQSGWAAELMFRTDRHTQRRTRTHPRLTGRDSGRTRSLSRRPVHISWFEHGRFWLVIDETGNMVTARQEPRLVVISLTSEGDVLTLHAPAMEDLLLPLRTPSAGAVLKCR